MESLPDSWTDRAALFAILAIIVSVIRYGTYFWSIYKRETKPHAFSWFNWGLVVAIGTVAQMKLHGGPSVWALAFVSVTCLLISVLAVFIGEKNITKSDWAAFLGALLAIPVWQATSNPMAALAILMTIDVLSYYPTLRKSWNDPWGEPPGSYFWAGLRYFFVLFAVPDPKVSNLIYPFFLMMTDWGFAALVALRRMVLRAARDK